MLAISERMWSVIGTLMQSKSEDPLDLLLAGRGISLANLSERISEIDKEDFRDKGVRELLEKLFEVLAKKARTKKSQLDYLDGINALHYAADYSGRDDEYGGDLLDLLLSRLKLTQQLELLRLSFERGEASLNHGKAWWVHEEFFRQLGLPQESEAAKVRDLVMSMQNEISGLYDGGSIIEDDRVTDLLEILTKLTQ